MFPHFISFNMNYRTICIGIFYENVSYYSAMLVNTHSISEMNMGNPEVPQTAGDFVDHFEYDVWSLISI